MMPTENTIENKVAKSSLVNLDLADFLPTQEIVSVDLADFLYEGLILKEKDYREQLKNLNINNFKGKIVAIHCSADAIIPTWAYMLMAATLSQMAEKVYWGSTHEIREKCLIETLKKAINTGKYDEKRLVLRGCDDVELSPAVFTAITAILVPSVKSILFGEACSTVPVYKKK